jgi:penicillin-binding protein 1A
MAYRHPGSTMKPLASYSQALQKNLITYSTVIEDAPLENYYSSGKSGPKNWYSGYKGDMFTYKALEMSVNTIPCQLVKTMGVESTYYFLYDKLQLTSLDSRKDMNLSALGLGGTNTGITTTQSAAAFAVFGNLGRYYTPTTFTLVTDQYDNTVLSQKDSVAALDENTACIMNHLLQNVVYGDEGTGKDGANFSETMKAYAKTGTSSETNDCWYVGGTPYYVGSCWFGYDESANVYNASLAKIMWTNVMKKVHEKLEPISFPESEFVTARYFCPSTGLLATDACPETKVGYYKTNYSLPAACTAHPGELLPDVKTVEEQLKAEEEAKKEQENGEGSNIEDGSQTESNNTQTESENQ